MKIIKTLISLVFPSRCVFCDDAVGPDKHICKKCERNIEKLQISSILKPNGYKGRINIYGAFLYLNEGASAIKLLKFCNRPGNAQYLGEYIAKSVQRVSECEYDAVCFVPMTAKQIKKRGYNQSELLARSVATALGTSLDPSLLTKTKENEIQHTLTKAKRINNVRGAYSASVLAKGKRILVIDDISTTGATLSECRRQLLKAGAAEVDCAAFAVVQ